MWHNLLYHLSRNQKKTLRGLGFLFLVLSLAWYILEWIRPIPFEPLVVLVGGLATFFAVYWPWQPTYKSRRSKGRISFDYMTNNHIFVIGQGNGQFTLQFSKASDTSIHMYRDPQDIEVIALIPGAGQITDVKDVTALDYSNRTRTPQEGELVALRNQHGNYAVIHIHDIRDATRSDDRDEVTFSYVINPNGETDFS